MAYILNSTTIKAPQTIEETNSTQVAQQRALSGAVGRDYFGSKKRIWKFTYRNTKKADFDTLNTIYNTYLSNNTAVTFESTESNYTIASTSVHVDLLQRSFVMQGADYISDFTLILTEA